MWFSSGSVVGRGVWWFVGRLSFEICPDAFMLPVLLIQIWIISGQWLNLVSFFFFNMKCRCCTAADKWVSYLEEYTAGLYRFFFLFFTQHVFTTFLTLFHFFITLFHTVYTHTRIHFTIRSRQPVWLPPWLSPNFWQILYHKDFKTGVWVCKSLSFNDFLCLCPVGGGLCLVSVIVIAGRVKSIW